jgi:hypothetical protein
MNIAAETPKTNNLYPLQVWLISVVIISPILLFVGSVIFDPSYYKQLDNYIIILLFMSFGLLYSLPTFAFCYLTFIISSNKLDSSLLIKTIFNAVCIAGIFITFSHIGGSEATLYSYFYSASVIISSFIFRVFKK